LEILKSAKETKRIVILEHQLSKVFTELSDILKENKVLYRECVLTAFSLNPTRNLFEKIEICAADVRKKLEEKSDNEDEPMEVDKAKNKQTLSKKIDDKEFAATADSFAKSLEEGNFTKSNHRIRANAPKIEHKNRVVESLLSIEGDILTEASNYDAMAKPMNGFVSDHENDVTASLVSDLVIAINAPRWQLLSWVYDWDTLKEQCRKLMENPTCKVANDKLEYLVIDYTQFDEWSSDEEGDDGGAIEKGYENWEDDEPSDEEELAQQKEEAEISGSDDEDEKKEENHKIGASAKLSKQE